MVAIGFCCIVFFMSGAGSRPCERLQGKRISSAVHRHARWPRVSAACRRGRGHGTSACQLPQVDGVQDVVDYFDATYMSGGMRVPQGPVTAQPALRLRPHRRCSRQSSGTCMRRRSTVMSARTTPVRDGTTHSRISSARITHRSGL